jgi:hypothetical protein
MRGATLWMICIVFAIACAWEARAERVQAATALPSSAERRAPANRPAPRLTSPPGSTAMHLDSGRGCPGGMAQLTTTERRALMIPVPGSYAEQLIRGALCIPLAMCAYLRANLPGAGGSSSTWHHHDGGSHTAFSCLRTSADGAGLDARVLPAETFRATMISLPLQDAQKGPPPHVHGGSCRARAAPDSLQVKARTAGEVPSAELNRRSRSLC